MKGDRLYMGNIYKVRLYEFTSHENILDYEYRTNYKLVCTILVEKGMFNRCKEISTGWAFPIYTKKCRQSGEDMICAFPKDYAFDNPSDRYLVFDRDFIPVNLASDNEVINYCVDIQDTRWPSIYEEKLKPSSSKGKRNARQLVRKMYK